MADPFSIVASAITVAGAAITVADRVLSFINQLRNAPNEVVFLQNEVTDTRLILSNIKDNASEDRSLHTRLALPDAEGVYGNPENISKAEHLVKRMERVLLEIDSTLKDVTQARALGRPAVHRRAWILHRARLKSLRLELRELKTNVSVHFSASSSTHAHRSVVLLKRVLLDNARTVRQQTERSDRSNAALQALAEQVAELSMMPQAQQQLLSLVEGLNATVATSEERSRYTTTTTTTTTELTDIPTNHVAVRDHGETEAPEQSRNAVVTRSTTVSTESISRLKLEFSRFQKRGCAPECECACHQRRRHRSPSFVQKILENCTQRSPFSATMTYYLPTIFLRKMISLVMITTSQGDPAACIKIRPLSTDFSIYRAIEQNDLRGVRSMLDRRLAHASATFKGAWTPLHYAINYGHTAICRSLLAVGADPTIEDGWNMQSPLEWAWTKILGGAFESGTQQEMERLFSDRDCLEEMRFTTLHRIILGLSSLLLEGFILQNPECINATDSHGRTALSWAAQRGMVEAVKTLLHNGADPNLCTPHGHSPLMYAAHARNPGCLRPLLDHHANVAQCDVEGQTPLHYAAGHRADLAYYRPLIEAGADPNWPTIPRLTPLTTVILEGHNEAVKYLAENGADIDLKGHDERSPAFYAVEYNNHFALEFLHERGAAFVGASIAYPSIAHVAAHHADIETLRILTNFRLTLRDVDCVDEDGCTIPQIVDRRLERGTDHQGDFAQAFRVFLESVRTEGVVRISCDVAEGDEFHDAVEQQAS